MMGVSMNLHENKQFRSLFGIGIFTNIGDSFFFIVSMWYVTKIAENPLYTGLVVFLFSLPEILLLFFGPLIDYFDSKKILFISTTTQISVHLLLITLLLTNSLSIYILFILLFFSALSSAIIYPIEETMIPQVVAKQDIIRANSWYTVAYKMTNSIFDGLAGVLLAFGSISGMYSINLLVFLIPLILIHHLPRKTKKMDYHFSLKAYIVNLKEGIQFVFQSNIKHMILPLTFLNFFTAMNIVCLPYFAKSLTNSPTTYGFILGISGMGSMIGSIMVNKIETYFPVGKILTFGLIFNGIFWILAIVSSLPILVYLFVFITNFCMGVYNVIFAAVFQVMTPKHLLGRVNTCVDSLITFAMPIGSLADGGILAILSTTQLMFINALALLMTGVFYFFDQKIYRLVKIKDI